MTPERAMAQRLRSYRIIEEDSDPSFATDIAEAAAMLESMADAQEWRPISTVPKDGRDFLTYAPDQNLPPLISQASYAKDQRCIMYSDTNMMGMGATHWLPLPPPPQAEEGAGT